MPGCVPIVNDQSKLCGIITDSDFVPKWRRSPFEMRGWAYLFGFAGGLLGGAYNTAGPPYVIYGNCRSWQPAVFKSNLQALFMVTGSMALLVHALNGNFTLDVARYVLLAVPAILIGIWLGLRLDKRLNPQVFSRLVLILLLKPFKRIPGLLIAVVAATAVVGLLQLDTSAGVKVLGPLPQGLPSFVLPWIGFEHLGQVVAGGFAVAMVAFADTSVLSRTYAAKTRSVVDPNQEMIGLGAANLASGLFQGFAISSSSSRTPVAEAAGAKTQLTGVVGALAVALLLLVAPNLLRHLPSSALAAIVIAAAIGLFEFADLRRILRIQPWEFWLSIACCVGVAVWGVIHGIAIAVVIAVIEFLWDGWRPHHAVMGRVDGIRGFHDIKRYPEARRIPGLVLFRWDAPLFFANAELFHQNVLDAVAQSPTPARRIVIAAEPVTSIDVTSADMLAELEQALRESGVEMRFAEMKDPVKDKLRRFEMLDRFGTPYPTIGAAVDAYLQEYDVEWRP